jgi:LmeA-like phospholipid-binding
MTAAPLPYRSVARKSRSGRWLIALLVPLVVLIGCLVLADRIGLAVAQNRVADELADKRPFTARPNVRIHGIPFVTQAVRGNYDDIEVNGPGELTPVGAIDIRSQLHGVHIPLASVRAGVQSVPIDSAEVTVRAPLANVARATGVKGLVLRSNGSDLLISAPVDVPVLGTVQVNATAVLQVRSGELRATVTRVEAAGLPPALGTQFQDQMGFQLQLGRLPYNAVVTSVRTSNGNVELSGTAKSIVLQSR